MVIERADLRGGSCILLINIKISAQSYIEREGALIEGKYETDVMIENLKVKVCHIKYIEKIMDIIKHDLTAIRNELRKERIKIYAESKDQYVDRHMFIYRGHTDRMYLMWNLERSEIMFECTSISELVPLMSDFLI